MKLPHRRQFLHLAAGAAALPAVSRIARAQAYPSRPITMVVAFAAGGSGDTIMRIVADHMRSTLGQTIVIENVGGAAGSIGVGRVARAAPDGYMLSYGNWPTHVLNGAVYALNYDVLKDFEPISLVSIESIAIVGRKSLPANDLKGLIAWLKATPAKPRREPRGRAVSGMSSVSSFNRRRERSSSSFRIGVSRPPCRT
jgi:tripartite-type tricarboxylate transporter receptor subunit TctC